MYISKQNYIAINRGILTVGACLLCVLSCGCSRKAYDFDASLPGLIQEEEQGVAYVPTDQPVDNSGTMQYSPEAQENTSQENKTNTPLESTVRRSEAESMESSERTTQESSKASESSEVSAEASKADVKEPSKESEVAKESKDIVEAIELPANDPINSPIEVPREAPTEESSSESGIIILPKAP